MIVPSIDLMNGEAVQLIGGREKALVAGDARPLAEQFRLVGDVAVVDLDAALGRGSNAALIQQLCKIAPCRVGGGIRSAEAARAWLDAGAVQVVLGTAAVPQVLSQLPRERVVAALDAVDGEVVVDGWRTRTGVDVRTRMEELRPLVGAFLVTFVEREGRLGGVDIDRARALRAAAGDARLTIAGGVTTADDVAALDAIGAEAQVGMALYTGRLTLADGFAAPLKSDRPDGLWPTVVVDERGAALGLAWSSRESLTLALEERRGVYHSRRRGTWRKGDTSGDWQELLRIDADCDRDALRFTVRQHGAGFCHTGSATCWGPAQGIGALERVLASRRTAAVPGSYSKRLFDDPSLLASKLCEEAAELVAAEGEQHVAEEAADLLYFLMVALARSGVSMARVEQVLDERARRVTRRAGDAKRG